MRYGCNWRRLPAQADFENVGSAESYLLRASEAIEEQTRGFVLTNVASSSTRYSAAERTANAHIQKRGKQTWRLKFDLGRDPATGKRLSRFVTFRGTKREAQAELNRLLNRRNEGTYVDPTKMSVAEYLEHWLTVDIERRVASHTHISHQLMDGVHVKIVSERAGHANVSITLSVYAAFIPTLQADAAKGVDTWLRQELADQLGAKSVPIRPFAAKLK
jgi:hypothetical protein